MSHGSDRHIPAIDGLRAVAVLAVLAYHLKLKFLPGGFTGVDIFFVISGYLISGIVFRELEAGRFSFTRFYERRIRRIAPALFAVLALSSVAFLLVFSPGEFDDFVRSLWAATFSLSNIYFYHTVDYFHSATDVPLLHTWSLAVEEQFYCVFPAILFLTARLWFAARFQVMLWVLGLASLATSVYLVWADQPAAFYFPTARLWELVAGAGLARAEFAGTVRPRAVFSWVGAAGTLVSVAVLTDSMRFPGYLALLPVCSACALIAGAGSDSPVNRLLSSYPARWIGRISYSLYLIHWPIISILACFYPMPNRTVTVVATLTSFTLAWLSWTFVETPFRRAGGRPAAVGPYPAFVASCIAITAIANIESIVLDGFWRQYPAAGKLQAYYRYDSTPTMRTSTCFLTTTTGSLSFYRQADCLLLSDTSKNVLVLGDSHSADLLYGLTKVFPHINFLQASASGCEPVLETSGSPYCTDLVNYIYRQWLPAHKANIGAIILSAVWRRATVHDIEATLQWVSSQGIAPVVLGPSPEFAAPVPRLLAYAAFLKSVALVDRFALPAPFEVDQSLKSNSAIAPYYISVADALCSRPSSRVKCEVTNDGVPLLFDRDHFTDIGSVEVVTRLKSQLERKL